MQSQFLIIGSALVIALVIVIIILKVIKKIELKYYRNKVKNLEVFRNQVASTPVLLELSKVEPIIKNDKMEAKYNKWQDRFADIKENRLTLIDDMLIDLDEYIDKREYKSVGYRMAKIEIEIYKVREAAEHLLDEIKDITLSEEKYRSIVIKLKSKYRVLNKEFNEHKNLYGDVEESIELQLENIERRFNDFEKVMDSNEYSEVVHVVKALDAMIEHMEIVVNETPDILLMVYQVIPNRMNEVQRTNAELIERGFPLDYLNVDYNIEESKKTLDNILEKVKVLNLEGCMFDLRTMLEYYDSLFIDFEKEKLSRKIYEEVKKDFASRLEKTNKLVNDVYLQLEDIKRMYDLSEDDIQIIHDVNKILVVINDDYNIMVNKEEGKTTPYSQLNQDIDNLTERLSSMEDDFDKALKSLGNMYDDEVRAREQLKEINQFLKDCKIRMRSYKLPVISSNYYVQLNEAIDAINEVEVELEKKPIVIRTLNTRVDTARDLVLKLYSTTNDMLRTAKLCESIITYGNRFRLNYAEINKGLTSAEGLFFKGDYKKALDVSLKAVAIVDEKIYKKIEGVKGE